ncbi:phospholipase D1 isoform X2 [Zootermopsis nevadensis]|uniref:phospholipase D1 isoform X2 n=1 Tax=Zootermopsis nevadensis TaxID=136037 RepID=UPI000B8E4C04|nr:phospholipase D1 isoform X2 [Zootermopsis nevadensis]
MVDVEGEPASPDSDYDDLPIPQIDVLHASVDGADILDAGGMALPFSTIHEAQLGFKAQKRRVFIPGQDISVRITDYERSVTTHLLNPNLYTIELQHGNFSWTIKRRYKHIQHLHQQLKLFRASLSIPFPTRAHRERRSSFKMDRRGSKLKRKHRGALPRFPNMPEALVPYENIGHRIEQLQEYLQNLLQIDLYRDHHETVSFLEVSHLSFVQELGMKGKEGLVQKRTGSTQPGRAGCNFCGLLDHYICVRCSYLCSDVCGTWRHRWLFVKDTYMGYIHPKDGLVKCVLLFDLGFEVSSSVYATGLSHGLQIATLSRQIVIKCWTKRKRKEWITYLKEVASNQARGFIQKNRYNSFAPERVSVGASWFVDGSSYMSAIANALEGAKEEIFIADWWLSPEIYLKRPCVDGDYWRLDKILERKAAAGVKVFVLLYKEVEVALGINSYYSKQRLVAAHHNNIKVLRHPDHAKVGVFLWAHHEKIMVVDQTYAFLGGLDLCYGRWDDHEHRLTDLGSISQTMNLFLPVRRKHTSSHPVSNSNVPHTLMHLATATNTVVGVLSTSQMALNSKGLEPSEKQYDEAVTPPANEKTGSYHVKCDTPPAERRSLMEKVLEKTETAKQRSKQWMHWLTPDIEEDKEKGEADNNNSAEVLSSGGVVQNGNVSDGGLHESEFSGACSLNELSGMAKYWVGKDYTNFIVKDFTNLDLPYQDLVDRNTTPRMPWHDVGTMVVGAAALDVARHFIQRWNAIKLEKAKLNLSYPYLLPKSYDSIGPCPPIANIPVHRVNCQVLRSASSWSVGFLDTETYEESIHEAYIDAITKAKHYVYIENQFFISLASHNSSVHNHVCETLYNRIVRAHKEGAVFRVYVVMPLLPGFEGEVGSPSGTALHAVTHWNYASICRGKEAILTKLKAAGVEDPSEYISFHGLRTHSILNGELVTELIYVHSKLLIADDHLVICGSANINDRSMLGKRDSEIAVIIKDTEFEPSVMGGAPYQCGRFAGSLRKHLFREHLGQLQGRFLLDDSADVSDPVSRHFYRDVWQHTAARNTQIYEEVFQCIPSDSVTNFQSLKRYQEEAPLCHTDPPAANKKLEDVWGHLVDLPLEFLSNEVLTPTPTSVQGIMPTALWT